MRVLIVGSGGREHALYWKLSQSPKATSIKVLPGNGGIPAEDRIEEPELKLSHLDSVVDFIRKSKFDLVVIGPEQPLVDGIVDELSGVVPVFGPVRGAARLEGSKEFAKKFMEKYNIPTAAARSFTDYESAESYIRSQGAPIVIKADGLAAGKGVTVATDLDTALAAARDALIENRFGDAGNRIVVEEFMDGVEASVFALCDGSRALPFIAAQDHKRAFDNDEGPNTGGMGAYTPVSFMTPELKEQIQSEILDRVISGMAAEDTPYRGLLYAGLMIKNNRARVVEFNVRFGDPETQALLRLLDEDLLELMLQASNGNLPERELKFLNQAAMVVVLAAEGYPGSYQKNIEINNLDKIEGDIISFHAGTYEQKGRILSSGGRILGVTATGSDLKAAGEAVYSALKKIEAPHTFYRNDIGRANGL